MIKIKKNKKGTWCVATKGLSGEALYWSILIAVVAPLSYLFCKYVLGV